MVKLAKIVNALGNNWKKSVCACSALAYGINYGIDLYRADSAMRVYCEEAARYGDVPVRAARNHARITVILNPAANNRKAKKYFDKYCAPLLHLSGVYVSILETENEGHARQIVERIDPKTDAIVVAGGDGTLSETVTGLMRTRGELCRIPIGVLPLGKTNTLANSLFDVGGDVTFVTQMAEATMAVVRGNTKRVDALRIELLDRENEEQKPVYGVTGIEWGAWSMLRRQRDRLWYLGRLREYASLVFAGGAAEARVEATLSYTTPCSGCSRCYRDRADLGGGAAEAPTGAPPARWWARLSNRNRQPPAAGPPPVDYKSIINESCSVVKEKRLDAADICLTTENAVTSEKSDIPRLRLRVGPPMRYQGQFLTDGWRYLKGGEPTTADRLDVKRIDIVPVKSAKEVAQGEKEGDWLSIDSEEYEVRPMRVTVLANSVTVFCNS